MSTSAVTDSDEALDVRADDFRAALERSLALADADGRIGPKIGATRIRMRFEFTDCDLALNVAAEETGERNLSWSFGDDPGWPPKLFAADELRGRQPLHAGAREPRDRDCPRPG